VEYFSISVAPGYDAAVEGSIRRAIIAELFWSRLMQSKRTPRVFSLCHLRTSFRPSGLTVSHVMWIDKELSLKIHYTIGHKPKVSNEMREKGRGVTV
jgi:hypothetical protein